MLSALGAAPLGSPLKQVLNFCLDPNGPVRDQDRITTICASASWSLEARKTTWECLKSDWSHIYEIYNGQTLLSSMIEVSLIYFVICFFGDLLSELIFC